MPCPSLWLVVLLLLPSAALAQSPAAPVAPPYPVLRLADSPPARPPGTPPAPAAPARPATDDELLRQLRLATEQLARHETELRELRAALATKLAQPAPQAVPVPPPALAAPTSDPQPEPWYERLQIRGYTQLRYNHLPSGVDNPDLINEQGDKSIGGTGGFFIRRARIILFGDVHPRVSIYLQPDFASAIGEQLNVGIVRDYYADVFLDRKKELRLRIGQSKIPFGFENLQSSQNRIPLDRNDALNSAVNNERDLGVFFYYAPDSIRKRFRYLVDSGLKGSGDYGVVGLGVYNGQTANRFELNRIPHVILRATWPFAIGSQILELGGGGYYGQYVIKTEAAKDGTKFTATDPENSFHDARGHITLVLYPKPLGLVFEYNVGIEPSQGRGDERTVIDSRFLYGGYLQLMGKIDRLFGTVSLIPYVRGTMYDGGKKFFVNAPRYEVRELELGLEWHLVKAFEVTAAYLISNRTSDKYPYEQQYGHVTRLQAQINY